MPLRNLTNSIRTSRLALGLFALLAGIAAATSLHAQDGFGDGLDIFPNLSLNGFGDETSEPVVFSARYYTDAAGKGELEVEAELAATWHIYSVTQKAGGPTRTTIAVSEPSTVTLAGPFSPNHQPHESVSSIYNGLTVEEHEDIVVWTAPITVTPGFEEPITVSVHGLICKSGGDNRCMPVKESLTATHAVRSSRLVAAGDGEKGAMEPKSEAAAKPFRDGDYVVEWTAVVTPQKIMPGQTGVLQFTAKPDPTFHVYKSAVDDSDSSTNFVVTKKDGAQVGQPVANKPFVTKTILPGLPPVSYYNGKVTWQLPIKVAADSTAGEKTIEGMIAYQACTEKSCHRPTALKFTAKVTVGQQTDEKPAGIELASAKVAAALDAAATTKWADPLSLGSADPGDNVGADDLASAPVTTSTPSTPSAPTTPMTSTPEAAATAAATPMVATPTSSTSFPLVLLAALLGGLILNVMPCVLPVVGLKIMGFVSQAGEDRGRILSLNLAYVSGIFAVFAFLAALAIVFNFGWGQQFQYFSVRLGITLGLFAFALSYFNIWEIPVPGMASGKTSQELQGREGLPGAFSKGVFATLLATPCSGPMLGGVFGATIGLPATHVALIFMVMALGMSTPYLLIGLRPDWIRWLPKPGAWMETFKQLMAFFFLAAVAYFFYQFSDENKFPVFVSLMGVWFGCWIIGLVPNWEPLQKRLVAWIGGISVATAIGLGAFMTLKADPELQWVNYSETSLKQYQAEGKTVLLEFSAKWCPNCIFNMETAIDTAETRELVNELDVVAMYADWTNYDEEITQKLAELNSNSIPVLAIYPGNRPNDPIILRDVVTQSKVLDALRSAGPSVDKSASRHDRDQTLASTNR